MQSTYSSPAILSVQRNQYVADKLTLIRQIDTQ
jgi:hypothetical protein